MKLLSRLRCFVSSIFQHSDIEREMDEELRSHIHSRADDLERSGLPRADAERRARIEFGTYERFKEECREAFGMYPFETLFQDVRYALRILRKTPGFTVVAVLTLALGIGANTAIFSLVNAVMLQSLPVRNPEQLVVLQWSARGRPENVGSSSYGDCQRPQERGRDYDNCSLSYPLFKEIRAQNNLFSSAMAFAGPAQLDLSGNGPASIVRGELVSGNYFQTLGVSAALGRTLDPSDEQIGAEAVVVLDYGYWENTFGGSFAAIGRTIRLNGIVFTIVGVANPRFTRLTPGKSLDMWLPLTQIVPLGLNWGGQGLIDAGSWWLTIVGRLKPEIPRTQAQAAVSVLFLNQTLHGDKPAWKSTDDPRITLVPAQKGLAGIREEFGEPLFLLMAAVVIVLLIACANVAGLLLARSTAREREMAVRLALGAGRRRVIQQLLTESMLLSFTGAALGVVLAYGGARELAAFLSANWHSPLQIDLHPDARVLAFTIIVALFTGIGFGLAPAFRGTSVNVSPQLKQNSGTLSASMHAGSRRFGLGSSLVVVQVALSMVVLIGAGLLVRTLGKLRSINPGFDTRNILLFSIDPTLAGYKGEKIPNFYDDLERRLAALPGVVSTSYSSDALLDGGLTTSDVHIEGQGEKSTVETQILGVGPGFFETMKIPVVNGRIFRMADFRSAQPVAIVNQAFVRRFLESRNAIGVHFGGNEPKAPQQEIVGVVGDAKYDDLRKDVAPTAYIPLKEGEATFALRTDSMPAALIPAVRSVVNDMDSNLPAFGLRTQSQTIDRLLFNERMVARLFTLFGALGLVLASIGLYALLSYEVARRTREIGIRAALGAQRRDALLLVIRQGLVLVVFGSVTGAVASIALTRLLQSLLYGVRPADPVTFAAVSAFLVIVGILACYIPARRAMRVNPVIALRYE